MDMQARLYYFDSEVTTFRADVIRQSMRADGHVDLRLSQSAFYPTSGGQPHDIGTIDGMRVLDVYVQDGDIVHVLESPLSNHVQVVGEIDWNVRFDHMQHHCGQHILSAAFEQAFDWDTVGFHLGEVSVTVDIDTPSITIEQIQEAEALANRIVWEDRSITARFVDPSEIPLLHLRHAPKVSENIRIVTIEGFDHNACGGTHPKRTGQVGLIKVVKHEKIRSATRLTFLCGNRALKDYDHRLSILTSLSAQLSSGVDDLHDGIAKLQDANAQLRKQNQKQFNELCETRATEIVETHAARIRDTGQFIYSFAETFDEAAPFLQLCKTIKSVILSRCGRATTFLLANVGARVHIQCESNGEIDAGAVLRSLLDASSGKGGGTAKAAQGSAPIANGRDVAWFEAQLREMLHGE